MNNEVVMESNKEERRRILGTLPNWNVGITPNGKLATESCFVHNSVPDIVYNSKLKSKIQTTTFTSTKAKWTSNLVQSNTSDPNDIETLKSLSICKSIFQKTEPSLQHETNTETLHLTVQSVKAYVIVDNIARLTKEFEDELSKAEEHWPHSPQKSWDKLCLIWNKYGFLWPQRVQIGFKIHKKSDIKDGDNINNVKDHLQIQSQDVLHSPKYYSVIWRTRLKPVHEYFPAQYNQKKEYINNIIHKCSILVFSDSLFRLRNIRSGDYLGRQSLEPSSHSDTGVIAIPSDNNNKSTMNASNIFWKFNDSITAIEQSTTPYIFVGNNKFLYSGQQSTGKEEVTLLSRSNNPGTSAFDRSNTPQLRAGIKLIQYKQPKGGQLKSTLRDMDESWKWSIGTVSSNIDSATENNNHHQEETFNLDGAINNNRCIIHGDEITLNQQSFYLRAASGSNYSTFNFSRPESTNSPPFIAKSPLSIISYGGDQYNFSPQGMMSDSNSTQPTSGSNSSFNSLSMQNNSKVTEYTKSRNIINPSPLQQQQQNNSIVFTEKLIKKSNTLLYPSTEYRWRVEMISKSLMDEQEEIVKVVKSLSLKNNISDDNHNTIEKNFKPYSPKLNPDIARFNSPDTTASITRHHRHNNAIQALIDSSHRTPLISSVVIVEDNNPQKQQALLSLQQKYSPQPPQKSKWLDVNPQLYNLQRQTTMVEENNSNENIPSRYSSAQEKQSSVKTMPSPPSSLLPEISEKKLGKQPLQQPKIQFTSNYNNHRRRSSPDSDDSAWTSSPVDKNDIVDLNTASTPTPLLTEAEAFKRGIQQSYKDKDEANKAQNIIFKNLFAPSLRSNTTSQMWNCDDDDEIIDHGSSQVRTYTMTPRRKYSQQFTPSSSANLTPEEYIQRRKNREQSFLLLVDRETTQQLWLRAFKESALNNWLKYLSPSARIIKQYQKRNATTAVNAYSNSIRSHRKSKSGNRIIQKKKPFYKKSNNRRQEGIVI